MPTGRWAACLLAAILGAMLPHDAPYAPLAAFLTALPPGIATVTLTFADLEEILGEPLPRSAATRSWWYRGRALCHPPAWTRAGWRVHGLRVRQPLPLVSFSRAG